MSEDLDVGNPLSLVLCDFYMHCFEEKLFKQTLFPSYTRYVDDFFTLLYLSKNNVNAILYLFNSIDPYTQFISEIETQKRLFCWMY